MVLDTSLLNTQQYKVRIKGKVEQYRETSSVLPYTSVLAFENEPSGRPRLHSPTLLIYIKQFGHHRKQTKFFHLFIFFELLHIRCLFHLV